MYFFEWDENKSKKNYEKHGVTFEESQSVFYDENAWLEYDNEHSEKEERFRLLGLSLLGNILIVVHCIRNEEVIRIISARKATTSEKKEYERRLRDEW